MPTCSFCGTNPATYQVWSKPPPGYRDEKGREAAGKQGVIWCDACWETVMEKANAQAGAFTILTVTMDHAPVLAG